MVWETREVRGEMNHSWFASLHFNHCCLLKSKTHQDSRRPLMHDTTYPQC